MGGKEKKRLTHTLRLTQITHWDVMQSTVCLSPQVWRLLGCSTITFLPVRHAAVLSEGRAEQTLKKELFEWAQWVLAALLSVWPLPKITPTLCIYSPAAWYELGQDHKFLWCGKILIMNVRVMLIWLSTGEGWWPTLKGLYNLFFAWQQKHVVVGFRVMAGVCDFFCDSYQCIINGMKIHLCHFLCIYMVSSHKLQEG